MHGIGQTIKSLGCTSVCLSVRPSDLSSTIATAVFVRSWSRKFLTIDWLLFIRYLCLEYADITCVSLVLRAVIRAALAAFLSCPLVFSLRFYICCWVNKERKKEIWNVGHTSDNKGVISLAGKVTISLVESNGSLTTGLWVMSPVDWLPRNQDQLSAQRSWSSIGQLYIHILINLR